MYEADSVDFIRVEITGKGWRCRYAVAFLQLKT